MLWFDNGIPEQRKRYLKSKYAEFREIQKRREINRINRKMQSDTERMMQLALERDVSPYTVKMATKLIGFKYTHPFLGRFINTDFTPRKGKEKKKKR